MGKGKRKEGGRRGGRRRETSDSYHGVYPLVNFLNIFFISIPHSELSPPRGQIVLGDLICSLSCTRSGTL